MKPFIIGFWGDLFSDKAILIRILTLRKRQSSLWDGQRMTSGVKVGFGENIYVPLSCEEWGISMCVYIYNYIYNYLMPIIDSE